MKKRNSVRYIDDLHMRNLSLTRRLLPDIEKNILERELAFKIVKS